VLFGNEEVNDGDRFGGRFHLGYFLDENGCVMLAADLFALEDDETTFEATSAGDPILARPFFNVDGIGGPDAELVAFPDVISGTVAVHAETDVWGGGAYYRKAWMRSCGRRLDFLAGYRFLRLDDTLTITESLVAGPNEGSVAQGTTFDIFDRFDVDNEFHGGEIGLLYEMEGCRWSLSFLRRVAFGATSHDVRIDGQTVTVVPATPPSSSVLGGGLLAQPTNIGEYDDSDFAVLPEVGATLLYKLNSCCRVGMGYTFMYLSDVARAGDQVDLTVNGQLLDGNFPVDPARPSFVLADTSLWIQGLSFMFDYRY
jgi:hypothetical protein